MNKTSLKSNMKKAAGYTIDQTILIVAVIAVLITLIIASVGWDLLNRTSGTKLASYLKQIEEANGAFYARQGVWPHVAVADILTSATSNTSLAVLASPAAISGTNQYSERWKPYLTGFDVATDGLSVAHQFGSGGSMGQAVDTCDDGKSHLVITLDNVPLTEITNADETIDGEIDETAGRVKYTDLTSDIQTMTYCGNLLN